MEKKHVAYIILAIIIATGVISTFNVAIQDIPIDSIPVQLQPHWNVLLAVLAAAPWSVLIAILRNISGYATDYYRSEGLEQYEPKYLKETLSKYIGIITTINSIAIFLPEPYGPICAAIGTVILVLLDLALTEYKHFKEGAPVA